MASVQLMNDRIDTMADTKNNILEMIGADSIVNISNDPRIDIQSVIADDDDPKFVNVEVIRSGISKVNRRRYSNNIVEQINGMIPGIQCYLGHPDPSKTHFEFREPHGIFVGSQVQELEGGVKRSIGKCYLFKTSPLREWIPKTIAAGNPLTVSINGTGDVMRSGDVFDVLQMNQLDSIDWANPGTEGVGTAQAINVVSEMQNNSQGGSKMEVKEIIQGCTVTEFKAFNPNGYENMVKGISITELQAVNPELVAKIQEGVKVTEMQLTVDGKQESVKLTELQGIISAKESKITELQGKIEDAKITEYKNRKIAEQIPQNMIEAVSKRVTGKTEADIDTAIANEITYIREMGGNLNNTATGQQQRKGFDEMAEKMKSMFGVKSDK